MLHDEKTFYEPEEFIPERWLNKDGSLREEMRDAELAAFGFAGGSAQAVTLPLHLSGLE